MPFIIEVAVLALKIIAIRKRKTCSSEVKIQRSRNIDQIATFDTISELNCLLLASSMNPQQNLRSAPSVSLSCLYVVLD